MRASVFGSRLILVGPFTSRASRVLPRSGPVRPRFGQKNAPVGLKPKRGAAFKAMCTGGRGGNRTPDTGIFNPCNRSSDSYGDLLLPLANQSVTRQSVPVRSEEHTSELQSLMRITYAVFCLKKQKRKTH